MMLEVSGLDIRYGATHAVRGVDFSIDVNETVCLLGPNGAGKSSLLRSISQLVPYEGSIRFDGQRIDNQSPVHLSRAGLIHVPEGRHIFPTLSVHENLQMGAHARAGRPKAYSYDDVYTLFPALGRMRKRQGYALSGGEQQMVALGRALVASPRLLLLDEPSLGLAPAVVGTVYKALEEVATRTTMLLVEQNTSDALSLAGRGYVLADGRFAMQGDSAELADRSSVLASYLGQTDAETSSVSKSSSPDK
ncbi:ABC transporter ATP-binding protein [Rhodococcus sp. NPDC056960]|uniref:ABC transporter ATP-binding protein n=1 Tax=Rhodococcus sp. NPDC056960 TaxID=3345982 RepID=UPI00363CB4E6